MYRVRLKKILQREAAFVVREIFGRPGRNFEKWIMRRSVDVVLNLRDQRWDKVESLVNIGKLVQQFHHAVVVFQGMQANPGKAVFTRNQIFVERLMLVPQNNNAQSWHLKCRPRQK